MIVTLSQSLERDTASKVSDTVTTRITMIITSTSVKTIFKDFHHFPFKVIFIPEPHLIRVWLGSGSRVLAMRSLQHNELWGKSNRQVILSCWNCHEGHSSPHTRDGLTVTCSDVPSIHCSWGWHIFFSDCETNTFF